MLRIDFVTLFPDVVLPPMSASIMGRAGRAGLVACGAVDPREFTTDNHRTVDDSPFGGGPGMLMKAEPVAQAIESVQTPGCAIILTDPTGAKFEQKDARALAAMEHLVFVCGHYEGIDDRIRENFATHVFSIGDFILTNGELPALVMADAVVRLLPGVLGSGESLDADSHSDGLLSAPQYTRPEEWRGHKVPSVLLSGDHKAIRDWRRAQALRRTRELRPDLFARAEVTVDDLKLLDQ